MSGITFLNMPYNQFVGHLGPLASPFVTPSAEEIRRLRQLCPSIKQLRFDTTIDNEKWPFDVLSDLAQFEERLEMTLWVHIRSPDEAKTFYTYGNCRKAYKYMESIRRSINLPVESQVFSVYFRIVQPTLEGWDPWKMHDYKIGTDKYGFTEYTKYYVFEASKEDRVTKLEDFGDTTLKSRRKGKMGTVVL